MTGRRPDYLVPCSVDIGVTDVIKNSRLLAVTSTKCSTLRLACCVCSKLFPPPIDMQQALVQHTQCPCRFVILATKALQSQASRQTYIRYSCGILLRVASGLFSWNVAAGLLAFSSRQFALTINHGPLSASHYFSSLSKRSGRRMPPAERSAL